MSSTFFTENLNVAGNVVFDKATNDLTLTVADQASGVATANVPDLGGVSQDFLLTSQTQTVSNKTIESSIITADGGSSTVLESATGMERRVDFDISGATDSTATTLDFNQTADRTITFPDASGTLGLQPTGMDNQVLRMDGTDMTQASGILLSDNQEFSNVRSITGEAGQPLTLTAETGQDIVLTTDVGQNVSVADGLVVGGDLIVNGTTTSVNSEVVTVEDNNILLSSNYQTSGAPRAGGITVNINPLAINTTYTATTVNTFTVSSDLTGSLMSGDFIIVVDAVDQTNNGLYQVDTVAAASITIASPTNINFVQTSLNPTTGNSGTLRATTIAAIQAGTDGVFEVASGSSNTMGSPLTFVDLATVNDIPDGGWTEVTQTTANATAATVATISTTTDKSLVVEVDFSARDQASTDSVGGRQERLFVNSSGTVTTGGIGSKNVSVVGSASGWGGGSPQNAVNTVVSGSDVLIQVQGAASTTIDWKILYRFIESP